MVTYFRPFHPEHLEHIGTPQALELYPAGFELMRYPSFSLMQNHRAIACGGMHPFLWASRWNAWAHMLPESGPHMLAITRFVRRILAENPVPRLEAHVIADFPQGFKFAQAIGLTLETPVAMRNWSPDGQDTFQFARTT